MDNDQEKSTHEIINWPRLLFTIFFILSLPGQYFISVFLGLVFPCGMEGSGCPVWTQIPGIIFFLIIDYLIIKNFKRQTLIQKIVFWCLFVFLSLAIIIGFCFLGLSL